MKVRTTIYLDDGTLKNIKRLGINLSGEINKMYETDGSKTQIIKKKIAFMSKKLLDFEENLAQTHENLARLKADLEAENQKLKDHVEDLIKIWSSLTLSQRNFIEKTIESGFQVLPRYDLYVKTYNSDISLELFIDIILQYDFLQHTINERLKHKLADEFDETTKNMGVETQKGDDDDEQ